MGGRKFGNGCVQASGRPVSLFFCSEIAANHLIEELIS